MLDINFIRENIDLVKKATKAKKVNVDIDQLIILDDKRRALISKIDNLRAERNKVAQERNIERGKQIKEELEKLEAEFFEEEKKYLDVYLKVPNIPAEDVPEGADESENVVIRKWGTPKEFSFPVKDHMELGESLDIIDTEKASLVSGARFNYLKGGAVMLQFALIQFTLKTLQNENILKELASKISPDFSNTTFIPIIPPVMIKPQVYIKMARLDSSNVEERYHLHKDDLYLVGSAEHTLGPLHMDETIDEKKFPIRYVGYSSAFRREAGSYGKDTKGILRVHQFDKIEMESFSLPENSIKEQDFIVSIQEYLMQSLDIPYQVVMICTGDMGAPDARQLDIESWMPSQGKYRETHTSDLMTDYQSRRLKTKVKRESGETELVHMNDATAFAIGRTLIAVLENYQQKDGSVKVPKALQPFVDFTEINRSE